jgi:hypothetical protein
VLNFGESSARAEKRDIGASTAVSRNDPPTEALADFRELIAVSKPEDRRSGPMVNGNPWPVRIFEVVDEFDGAGDRYGVGHGGFGFHCPLAPRPVASQVRRGKRPNAAVPNGTPPSGLDPPERSVIVVTDWRS